MELDRLERHELDHDKLEKREGYKVKVKYLDLQSKYINDQDEESQFEDDGLVKKMA